jgi:hypothetical protein
MLTTAYDSPDSPVFFVLEPILNTASTTSDDFGIGYALYLLVDWAVYAGPDPSGDLRPWLRRRTSAAHCLAAIAQIYCAGPAARVNDIHLRYGRQYAAEAVRWNRLMSPA